jgi:hypothetical protein
MFDRFLLGLAGDVGNNVGTMELDFPLVGVKSKSFLLELFSNQAP